MSVFRFLGTSSFKLNQPVAKLRGRMDVDEVYQTAGLKGGNNGSLIKMLG